MAGLSTRTLLMVCGWTLLGLASVEAASTTAGATMAGPTTAGGTTAGGTTAGGTTAGATTAGATTAGATTAGATTAGATTAGATTAAATTAGATTAGATTGGPTTAAPKKCAFYTRWGRTSCPSGATLVYKGWAGGSWWNHKGAAVNYLCLPEDPQSPASSTAAANTDANFVFGAEYQTYGRNNFDNLNQDVPCAVCEVNQRGKVVMIPARTSCYTGLTLEYEGYLMAGHHGLNAASEYVCVDKQPEVAAGGGANDNGKLFYFVEARCGSLKCPPYVTGQELSCVVCSK